MIELINIYKVYNEGTKAEFEALRGVNLKVKEGEFVSIMGASGSGKSTLLHIMGCLDRPTKGKVYIDGVDVSKLDEKMLASIRSEKIGFVFQFFFLFPTLTALENVLLPMFFSKKIRKKEERAKKLLSDVGLKGFESHYPNELSGGQRQKVAIARALSNDPKIILADEPTGNLDSKSGKEILKLLVSLNKKYNKTLVIVTHDKNVAKLAKRIVILKDGKIIKEVRS